MMNLNVDLFYLINNNMANPVFDAIMPVLSNFGGFVTLLAICIAAILILKYLKKRRIFKDCQAVSLRIAIGRNNCSMPETDISQPKTVYRS